MDDLNVPIFSQAKLEYTKQLVDVLYMNMYDGVRSIYDDSKKLYMMKPMGSPIYIFRSLLEKVPKWNTEIIDAETERITIASKCDWLDDLLTAVFISHTRILMSIGPNQNYNKINVTIPKTTTFIHKSYINISREVWKNPYLFNEQVPGHEYQRNMKQLEDMIKLTIEDTIRRQLPIKEILREHLETYDEPKQETKPLDMQMILNELKKATASNETQNNIEEEEEKVNEETTINDINFTKEEEEIPESPDITDLSNDSPTNDSFNDSFNDLPTNDVNEVNNIVESKDENIYHDPGDPNEDQIKKACQNIVLNDITEPVIEETYDNVDIVNEVINNDKDKNKKLEDMMSELTSKKDIKPVTTDIKLPKSKDTSVIKINDNNTSTPPIVSGPVITKLDEHTDNKHTDKKPTIIKLDEPKIEPTIIKLDEPVKEESSFSFSNLYPNISGTGKVEDITKKEDKITKKEENKDINASIMKEVISLDKKEDSQDDLDETITLDNFFNDIKELAGSSTLTTMEPIKEDIKYTLFEDANETES